MPVVVRESTRLMVEGYRDAGIYALIAVTVCLLLFFRSPFHVALALLVLAVGGAWLLALVVVTGSSINPANLVAFPLLLGIGVDSAVHVIHRAREQDEPGPLLAGSLGRALIYSTLTSVAIFLPILFMVGMEGQLFKDLAITLTTAVSASLITAMTILPATAMRFDSNAINIDRFTERWRQLANTIIRLTNTQSARLAWVTAILGSSIALGWAFLPKVDFLPKARIDSVQTYFSIDYIFF